MAVRRMLAVLGIALVAVSCSDRSPVQVDDRALAPADASEVVIPSGLLDDIPVAGTLSGGGSFAGLLDVTEIDVVGGQILVSGALTGAATMGSTVVPVSQGFTDVVLDVTSSPGKSCKVLTLDLRPIAVPALGQTVNLSGFVLNTRDVIEPGRLNRLRNVLCKAVRKLG